MHAKAALPTTIERKRHLLKLMASKIHLLKSMLSPLKLIMAKIETVLLGFGKVSLQLMLANDTNCLIYKRKSRPGDVLRKYSCMGAK
jgi:hypothetical protein